MAIFKKKRKKVKDGEGRVRPFWPSSRPAPVLYYWKLIVLAKRFEIVFLLEELNSNLSYNTYYNSKYNPNLNYMVSNTVH